MEKNEIWGRWKAGQSMHAIGRAYGRPHPTVRKLLLPRGGIAPIARRRSRLALTLAEREDILRRIASGSSVREIARGLSRATSTVSREIVRHGGRPSVASAIHLSAEPPRISAWVARTCANRKSSGVCPC